MKAISILLHSVKLLFSNIDAALRVSLVLYVVIAVVNIYFQIKLAPYNDPTTLPTALPGAGFWLTLILAVIVMAILGLWMAVAWHRYILLEELPAGYMPEFHSSNVISYFGRGLLIGIICVVVAMVVGLILGVILGTIGGAVGGAVGGALAGFVAMIVALVLFYRMSPILPAAAVGEPLGIGDAMAATRGQSGTIVLLAIIGAIAVLILQLPSLLGNATSVLSLVYSAVVGWFTTLIGISVLTTFYGHFVQGRDIK